MTAGNSDKPFMDKPFMEKPFTRPVMVEDLLREPRRTFDITADPQECAALAKRNGLVALSNLTASFRAEKAGKFIRITGSLKAGVTQTCVVTLDPFEETIADEIDERFFEEPTGPAMRPAAGRRERRQSERAAPPIEAPSMDEEEAEAIVDGRIDLGALAAECFSLALDPYPRKRGATFQTPQTGDEEPSPFAALAALKARSDGKKP